MDILQMIIGVVLFFVVLSFLIIIHELGHFLTAKFFGVKVKEFAIGFPPRIKKVFTWMSVPFVLNSIPLGGYVQMQGENGPEEDDEETKRLPGVPFFEISAIKRLIIIVAGASVNLLFGVIAFTIVFSFLGVPTYFLKITDVAPNGPAATAGIRAGDQVVGIRRSQDFIRFVSEKRGEVISLRVLREGQEQDISVRVRTQEETPAGEGSLGVVLMDDVIPRFYPWYEMPIRATEVGVAESVQFSKDILQALADMGKDVAVNHKVPSDVAGPVGILNQTVKQQIFSQGIFPALYYAGMLSINLGVMNLLPIPALDGGRAVFILIEQIVGRKRQAKVEAIAHQVGFALLIGLIILITVKDIWVMVGGK